MERTRMIEKEVVAEDVEVRRGLIGRIRAKRVHLERGGAAIISAKEQVYLNDGGGMALISGRDLSVTAGGGQFLIAGRDLKVNQGGGQFLIAGKDLQVREGGGVVMIGKQARVEGSRIGLLISGETELGGDSQVIFNTPQAIALGAALGLAFAGLSFLIRRRLM